MITGSTRLADGTEDPKPHTPPISLFLAYIAMVPTAAGAMVAASASLASPRAAGAVSRLTVAWAGAVLCFLAGVKRGLSFRQAGGPTVAQLGTMLWVFVLGAGALLLPGRAGSLVLLLVGYGSEAVLGPVAAERDEAPRYFERLRPAQMLVPVASLLVLLALERRRERRERA